MRGVVATARYANRTNTLCPFKISNAVFILRQTFETPVPRFLEGAGRSQNLPLRNAREHSPRRAAAIFFARITPQRSHDFGVNYSRTVPADVVRAALKPWSKDTLLARFARAWCMRVLDFSVVYGATSASPLNSFL